MNRKALKGTNEGWEPTWGNGLAIKYQGGGTAAEAATGQHHNVVHRHVVTHLVCREVPKPKLPCVPHHPLAKPLQHQILNWGPLVLMPAFMRAGAMNSKSTSTPNNFAEEIAEEVVDFCSYAKLLGTHTLHCDGMSKLITMLYFNQWRTWIISMAQLQSSHGRCLPPAQDFGHGHVGALGGMLEDHWCVGAQVRCMECQINGSSLIKNQ